MDKTFDAAGAEARIYAEWEGAGAFRAGANARPGADTYCIVIPPPNVTGSLHMGHALNNTIQDILIRWKRMQGFDVLWQPGQDHAGIATQMVVERRLAAEGRPGRREMTREEFVDLVWKQKDESGDVIINQLKRLGASCDWSRNAFTLGRTDDDQMSRAVLRVFKTLYDEGLIYRGKRLVNWDPHFETAISDLEVENVEVDGHFWHFRYPLAGGETYDYVEKDADGNVTFRETRDYIAIATTRPETMLGDGAVAVHPSDARYAPIVGKMVHLPLCDRLIPIITDDYPDPDFGSGAVKITGAHDFNDYAVAMRNDIPLYPLMDGRAHMRADKAPDNMVPGKYRGLDRFAARKAIVADIAAQGLMIRVEDKKIMQPFGDRSKVVIEPYLTDQWFVDAKTLAQPALAAVREGRTTFAPENWDKTYFQWLENIEPWCISRQLWWGHQIPVWYGPVVTEDKQSYTRDSQSGSFIKLFCAISESEALEQAQAYYGPEADVHVSRLDEERHNRRHHGEEPTFTDPALFLAMHEVGKKRKYAIHRDPDVLDTWFSSALWPFSTLGWPDDTDALKKYYPGDVLVTGFDIIFFWVARMMMMGLHFQKDIPFHTVYVHALVRDEDGKKMSKSLGNVIDPLDLIDQYGADAVRMTLASMAAMGRDIRLSVARVEGYRNFGTKLWNAARFAGMNGCARVPGFDPASAETPVNRWIVGETARLRETVDAALEAYRFNDAANALYAHVWGVYCDWYLELAKPLLQDEDSPAKAETQATAAWALDQLLVLLHPIMPFITESLWQETGPRETMLIHAAWPALDSAALADPQADGDMGWTIALIEAVRSARAEMNVSPGAQIPLVVVGADAQAAGRLERNDALIRRVARIASVTPAPAVPKGAITVAVEGATLCLPLAGVIDIAAESARLGKAMAKLDAEIGGLSAKLANEAFTSRAPAHVIEEQRGRLEDARASRAKLAAAAARLAEAG
jgi:valyl-tRNA synthetase